MESSISGIRWDPTSQRDLIMCSSGDSVSSIEQEEEVWKWSSGSAGFSLSWQRLRDAWMGPPWVKNKDENSASCRRGVRYIDKKWVWIQTHEKTEKVGIPDKSTTTNVSFHSATTWDIDVHCRKWFDRCPEGKTFTNSLSLQKNEDHWLYFWSSDFWSSEDNIFGSLLVEKPDDERSCFLHSLRVSGHVSRMNRTFSVEEYAEDDFGQWAKDEVTRKVPNRKKRRARLR